MEVEAGVEKHSVGPQRRFSCREEYAVEQLAIGGHRSIEPDRAEGVGSVRDRSAEIYPVIPSELVIHECPGRLVLRPAAIAGNSNHIVLMKALDDAIGKKVIVDPGIVMDEDEQFRAVGSQDARVEDVRKPPMIREHDMRNQANVMGKSSQRYT